MAGILDLGIIFRSDLTNELINYTDSDWTRLKNGKRFINRYVFILLDRPISYQFK